MAPADQRLEPAHLAGLDAHQRLVEELEFLLRERLAKVELERPARLHQRVHRGLEEAVAGAALGLRAVERDIGVLEQLIGVEPVGGRDRDADAGADDELLAADLEGEAKLVDEAGGERGGACRLADIALDDRELVAADAGDGVGLADEPAHARRGGAQQRIAGGVALRVVDALELVEVEPEHGAGIGAARAGQHLVQPLAQQHAVGKAGERVVPRHVGDPRLRLPLLGDVLVGRDPPAIRHRLVANGEDAAVAQLDDRGVRRVAEGDMVAPGQVLRTRHGGAAADFEAPIDDLAQSLCPAGRARAGARTSRHSAGCI